MYYMRGGKTRNLRFGLISFVLFVFLIITIKTFFDNFWRLKRALDALKEKESIVASLELENENIKRRIEELGSDLYVERQLRDNLGMAKEGETVVILPNDEELRKLIIDFDLDENRVKLPVWQQWLEVFRF